MTTTADPLSLDTPIEQLLAAALPSELAAPEALHRAMRHAVLTPGKRLRPRLLLTVADSCRGRGPQVERELVLASACAVELVHSASLAHDDLPCFDNAAVRRGAATVHARFGEAMAVLVGDALLAHAFELVANVPCKDPERALRILTLLGRTIGSRDGIIGGQSMELGAPLSSPEPLARYHAMKTAALFRLAAEAGAIAMGVGATAPWARIGTNLGLALQLTDDLLDVRGEAEWTGKPVRRDAALGRPNAALLQGEAPVLVRLQLLLAETRQMVIAHARDPQPLLALVDRFVDQARYPRLATLGNVERANAAAG